ncbi:HGL042Wp [Eremothecium sinecaudum]|uniref:HGL042Wp n=1 Tax=Eremothecium sinecaudum TaxID=45286 RepID=A0A0X8HVQ8_9SACH|nr:HGL042Wp [Eremothecium sinecaudum]AMD22298.1 HGL042Wp [Eremothecium sinecaudum]
MRAAQLLLNAAKKKASTTPGIPLELTPLFIAMGVAVCSGTWFTYRHLAHDKTLRLYKNPDISKLDEVLKQENEK